MKLLITLFYVSCIIQGNLMICYDSDTGRSTTTIISSY